MERIALVDSQLLLVHFMCVACYMSQIPMFVGEVSFFLAEIRCFQWFLFPKS